MSLYKYNILTYTCLYHTLVDAGPIDTKTTYLLSPETEGYSLYTHPLSKWELLSQSQPGSYFSEAVRETDEPVRSERSLLMNNL